MLSRLVITSLPRSKRLLISWLQSPSAVILEPIFFFFSFFLLAVLGLRCCAGFSLVLESAGYSPVAGHTFFVAGASHCGARAPGHRLTVVSQGLSCSHTWDLLKPGSSATLTSYVRIESEGYEGDVCYWCLAGKEGDPSQMVRPPDFLMGLP